MSCSGKHTEQYCAYYVIRWHVPSSPLLVKTDRVSNRSARPVVGVQDHVVLLAEVPCFIRRIILFVRRNTLFVRNYHVC